MPKYTIPTPDELRDQYGDLMRNSCLDKVATWALPNASERFDEATNLEYFEKIDKRFKQAAKEVFE